jgi:predicted RNase H-like HicB family nuclease
VDIQAEIHQEDDGSYWAKVVEPPELTGVFAAGDSLDEVDPSLREGIELCLPDRDPTADGSRPLQVERLALA